MELPNMRECPKFDSIFAALERLLNRKSINTTTLRNVERSTEKDLFWFPLCVIKSNLDWISVDEKDIVYDLASKIIAGNCGRTVMPERSRKWVIPATSLHPEFDFILREPSLTGDDLGLKTWATSFAISQDIGWLGRKYFSQPLGYNKIPDPNSQNLTQSNTKVLELGSGTGLFGIAAAAVWGVSVLSTDVESIQENLKYNIEKNIDKISQNNGGSISCTTLDWRFPEKAFSEPTEFELIIAADPCYDEYHPIALANTVDILLKKDFDARILVSIPFRDKFTVNLSREFKDQMLSRQFQIVGVEFKFCSDEDWEAVNEVEEVQIESTIWKRS